MRICSLKTAVFITVLTAFSCNMPPSFGPEYGSSSTNFIARLPLAAPVDYTHDDATTPFNILASWDWAWRDGTSNTYKYMTSELKAGDGPGGSDAWLLTMADLGKDRVCSDTDKWTNSLGATLEPGSLHGSSLKASFTSTRSSIYIDKGFFNDGDTSQHKYRLFMNAKDADGLRYIEHSGASYPEGNLQTISGINSTFFIDFFPSTDNKLHLTKQNTNPVYLDDVSAIRTDVAVEKWALCLRLSLKDTEPSLVPGLYAFSVWVKKPDGYAFSTESGRGDNPLYASRFVTLSIIQSSSSGSPQTSKKSFDLTDPLVYPALGGWSRLELRLSKHEAFYFSESAEGQQIELRIACIGSSGADMEPGSVLIAGPSLNFYKNGF